jgi:hypothetical protein
VFSISKQNIAFQNEKNDILNEKIILASLGEKTGHSTCFSLHMYICIYIRMCVCMYIYTYVCVYVCIYIYVCVYVCICVGTYVCINVYIYVGTYVCMYVCTYKS